VFDNDFAALKPGTDRQRIDVDNANLIVAQGEPGICRVICFSPRHDLTLATMETEEIEGVVHTWVEQYRELGTMDSINHVQIFENKGSVMGCSNPHPHGQIWAQSSLPTQVEKTQKNLKLYFAKNNTNLLHDYLQAELKKDERIVIENEHFAALVPFWAIWPYETMIISKRHISKITDFTSDEVTSYAIILKQLTTKYDNLFSTSFPYSSGIHQAPTDGEKHEEWQFHMHFYPPLLRSASVKKFMVGYEMLGESQRDITPEKSAAILREQSDIHYKNK